MRFCVLLFSLSSFFAVSEESALHPTTGLVEAPGHDLVAAHCIACHSTQLIKQNRMSRESWKDTIRWMQKTQGLWPLGEAEPVILDYLASHYSPRKVGRRAPIPAHLMPPSTSRK